MGEPAQKFHSYPTDAAPDRLRLLSYNIQAGVDTRHYREYLTHSWKQVLPHRARVNNLDRIARMAHAYDLVGLQEVDSGSLRSGFVDQTEYLAHRAAFPYWYSQVNRSLGKIAQHSNGVLSRLRPGSIHEHKLPGLPGRGAILVELPTTSTDPFAVCVMHLALGRGARQRQLTYITELVSQYSLLVIMGDFNCGCHSKELQNLVEHADLKGTPCDMKTFPSWRPMHKLDHILVSSRLDVGDAEVLGYSMSDHLPVSMQVILPEGVRFAALA